MFNIDSTVRDAQVVTLDMKSFEYPEDTEDKDLEKQVEELKSVLSEALVLITSLNTRDEHHCQFCTQKSCSKTACFKWKYENLANKLLNS